MIHSPFPGMDPYLEGPSIWPDVHTSLMSIFREQLTPLLAPKYLAELEAQLVIDRLDDDSQGVLADVNVTAPDMPGGSPSAVAVAAPAPVRVRVPLDVAPFGLDPHSPTGDRAPGDGDRVALAGR